jgi:Zn-dependent protease
VLSLSLNFGDFRYCVFVELARTSDHSGTAGTIRGFNLFGVPVRLHFTFVLLVIFLVVTDLGAHQTNGSYALFLVGLFASVLLHEMGHAFVGKRFGVKTTEIVMFPIGGLSRMERMLAPTEELLIALAGPAVNLLLSAGIFAYMYAMHLAVPIRLADLLLPTDANAVARLAYGNLVLAGFNLLPAFPMDGGRILRALLSYIRP